MRDHTSGNKNKVLQLRISRNAPAVSQCLSPRKYFFTKGIRRAGDFFKVSIEKMKNIHSIA